MTGTTFAHSRVVCKLNGGGMNILYEAEDLPIRPLLRIEFNPKNFRASGKEGLRLRSVIRICG